MVPTAIRERTRAQVPSQGVAARAPAELTSPSFYAATPTNSNKKEPNGEIQC